MMDSNLFSQIDSALQSTRIESEVRNLLEGSDVLSSEDGSVVVEGEKRFIPSNVIITIIGKIVYSWNFQATYGQNYCRVKVALGKTHDTEQGWIEAEFGFIVLMYDEQINLIKAEWSELFEFDD